MATRRWAVPASLFGLFTAFGLSRFAYLWLDDLARAREGRVLTRFIEEMTGAYAGLLVLAFLIWLVPRFPLDREHWRRRLPGYVGIVVLLGAAHTTMMWVTRTLLFPVAGLGAYDYGIMRYRYPMEFAIQAPNIAIWVVLLHAWRWYSRARARELEAARLEQELSRATLERLEAQLEPHFLFNTLNVISSLMYHDPGRADRMLGRLSDLLRLTFQRAPDPEVPLADELEWLGWYLQIMQLRFGDRLTVSQQIAPDTLTLAVPRLILQPLVENALKHGPARHAGPASVTIAAQRDGARLRISVSDDGPGMEPSGAGNGNGLGLTNTAERLQTLYRAEGRLLLGNRPEGGLTATVELPARTLARTA
jgi:two-component system, LytTR family, sensor kinase